MTTAKTTQPQTVVPPKFPQAMLGTKHAVYACNPTKIEQLLCRNTRGSMLVRRAIAVQSAEQRKATTVLVESEAEDSPDTAESEPEDSPDTAESESEEEKVNGKISVKILSSPFKSEDIIPQYNKRRPSSLSPNAKAALKDMRAKRAKNSPSPPCSPPSPYNGVLLTMGK
jgi:hypothetical protein